MGAEKDESMNRYGMTIPFDGVPLLDQEDWIRELADLGFSDFWSAESGGNDGFTPLILAAQWAKRGQTAHHKLTGTTSRPRAVRTIF